ncbi:acyl-CoA thioesterase family protein [Plantactinospora soyae]|uniref:Acyl-CoA thioesterase FadM n=1 Tax=Plantactinospora soyae TaxID=1544732 RepID=A0A927R0V1_9ACTN|nr:thioesterase [Plantactinospora soyae]MBE1492000.1 acyl-CoA thioesterase FadM [Plantactinospora soyae]
MNSTTLSPRPVHEPVADAVTRVNLRPRYEGSNICTWIGFKHVNYLVEEAVLDHLRQRGLAPGGLYETYGLCVDIVDIDSRITHAFHIDDVAMAEVRPLPGDKLAFAVEISVDGVPPVKAVTAKVRVELRLDPHGSAAEPVPDELATYAVARLGTAPVRVDRPAAAGVTASDDVLAQLTAGRNAYAWKWRIPYFYCHFTERMQMSGYLRQMEEVVDLFLADRGVSIKTLLDEQDWIPVVPHSRITLLDEARMEEELYTVFTVESVFKRLTYTSRMDCYVLRDGVLVPTATGRITHGYAVIENRRDWSLVTFDDRLAGALEGAPAAPRTRR